MSASAQHREVIVDWLIFDEARISVNKIAAFEVNSEGGHRDLVVYLDSGHRLRFAGRTAEEFQDALTKTGRPA